MKRVLTGVLIYTWTKQLNMDHNVESKGAPLNIVTLPSELLIHIISFLTCVRDKVKLRYVSRRCLSVCETPLLWRELIWPFFDIREKRCVISVLKSCGKYVQRLSFPDHVEPGQLTMMLQYFASRLTVQKILVTVKIANEIV